jgi:hypothetical protein
MLSYRNGSNEHVILENNIKIQILFFANRTVSDCFDSDSRQVRNTNIIPSPT